DLVRLDVNFVEAWVALSDLEREHGTLDAAETAANAAVAAEKYTTKRPEGYVARGRALLEQGRVDEAEHAFADAVDRDGRSAAAAVRGGGAVVGTAGGVRARALGEARRAADLFAAARGSAADGLLPGAAAKEGHALAKLGDAATARVRLEKALELEAALGAE